MSEAVLVAVISLLGVIFTAVWQNKRLSADFEKRSELADARLERSQAVTNEKIDTLIVNSTNRRSTRNNGRV